jgi:hypothetical protein
MDKHDYAQAVQLYREVTTQAPGFSPALRRLCWPTMFGETVLFLEHTGVSVMRRVYEDVWTNAAPVV